MPLDGKVDEFGYPAGAVVGQVLRLEEMGSAGIGVVKIGVAVTGCPRGTTMRSAWMLSTLVLNVPFENTVMVPVEAIGSESGWGNWVVGITPLVWLMVAYTVTFWPL